MSRVVRLAGETRRLLARVWRDHARPPLMIDPRAIKDVTRALRSKIADDVLAILAAEGRTPAALPALTGELATFFDATYGRGSWRSELEFDHVVFARLPGDESEPLFASFRRGPSTFALWDARRPQRGGTPLTLAAYVSRTWTGVEAISDPEVAAFAPVIEAPPPPPLRQVSHPSFGVGTVLDRRDGKLRIDFGPHGVKVIGEKYIKSIVND